MAFTQPTAQKLLTTEQDMAPPPAYVNEPSFYTCLLDRMDEDDDDERLSAIHLRVNNPLTVKGDGNLIAIDASASASMIAIAIVGALKQMSMNQLGIPMIDENGCPRPIKVEIMAETTITGSKNVIGEKAVFAATMNCNSNKRKAAESAGGAAGSKRQRAMSEPLEHGGKRARIG